MWSLAALFFGIQLSFADNTLLETAKSRWVDGDPRGVISIIEPWLDTKSAPYGNERLPANPSPVPVKV